MSHLALGIGQKPLRLQIFPRRRHNLGIFEKRKHLTKVRIRLSVRVLIRVLPVIVDEFFQVKILDSNGCTVVYS